MVYYEGNNGVDFEVNHEVDFKVNHKEDSVLMAVNYATIISIHQWQSNKILLMAYFEMNHGVDFEINHKVDFKVNHEEEFRSKNIWF